MGVSKNLRSSLIILGVLTILFLVQSVAAESWNTITSFKDARRMRLIDDTLWVASSGGLLAIADPDQPGATYTNLNDLGTTNLNDIMVDAAGRKWISGFGSLVRMEGTSLRDFPTGPVYGPLNLYRMADDGDRIWMGSDSGLVLFSKIGPDDGGYRNRYRITSVNPFPVVEDVTLDGDQLWLATNSGVATADKNDPMLISPLAWTVFDATTNPELETNDIRRVVHFDDSLYVLTFRKIYRMSIGVADTTFTEVVFTPGQAYYDMAIYQDSLFFYVSNGIWVLKDGPPVQLPWAAMPDAPQTGLYTGSFHWVASIREKGIYENRTSTFSEYVHSGTPGNDISDVTTSRNGGVTVGFRNRRAAQLVDGFWETIEYSPSFKTTVLNTDRHDNRWVATEGGGLWWSNDTSLLNYNDTNSTVVGNNDDPPSSYLFAWVTDMVITTDYLFASLYKAYTAAPLPFARLDSRGLPLQWDAYGVADGITDSILLSVDHRSDGVLGAGSKNTGLFWYDYGSDPVDRGDDRVDNFTTSNSGIPSNFVNVVRFSPEGELWTGTTFGLARLDESLGQVGEIGRFVVVQLPAGFGPNITTMEFDSRGNVWLGSLNGMARYEASFGTFEHFTTTNSGLVSDTVRALTLDSLTGDLWSSTPAAIAVLRSATGVLTRNLDSVLAYPNPFVIRNDTERLQFNIAGKYKARVFTVAGELVWEVPELSDESWDGRNQSGEPVASGVYLFVLEDADGGVARGKFLLVRE
jgi:ligand-binding sensor domain-containing protein